MEQDLFGSARKAASQQKSTSQKLQSAGNSLRDNRLQEKVSQSGQFISRGMLDVARERERTVKAIIDDLKDKIASAEKGLDSSPSNSPEERLGKAAKPNWRSAGESRIAKPPNQGKARWAPGFEFSSEPAAVWREKPERPRWKG